MKQTKGNLGETPTPIYTLQKKVTEDHAEHNSELSLKTMRTGSDSETVGKWAEKKYKANHIADALMQVAYDAEEWDWYHRYRYTKEKCLDCFFTGSDKAFGKYCESKWCPVCLGIRKAVHINQYYPEIKNWSMPTFLTLTAQAHKHEELGMWFTYLESKLNRILNKFKIRNYRAGKGEKFKCLICIECCFNPLAHIYNPHFHIITSTYGESRDLMSEWIRAFSREQVHPVAQYMITVDAIMKRNQEKYPTKNITIKDTLKELIKYSGKILTDAEMKKGKER